MEGVNAGRKTLPFARLDAKRCAQGVGSHLGLRISNFVSKKPSNVRISTKSILTFDGLASPLERQAGLSRIGVRTLFAPVGSSHPEQR
jgi:hypothetical protein